MKTKILSTALLGLLLCFTGCNEFLDMSPTDKTSDKLVWSKVEYAELAINNFYHNINYFSGFNEGQCKGGMTEALTDAFKYSSTTYNAYMYVPNEMAYGGTVLSATYVDAYWGCWGTAYERIRRVNEGLYNMHKYSSFDAATTARLEAEMRFFRAHLYFELLKRYKEVIIYGEDVTQIQKNAPLSTEAAGWDFVEADLRFAGENLPVSKAPDGRLTSGAAYALMSRAMLYAERWEAAKTAAKKVIDMGYTLVTDYKNVFTAKNSEVIFQYSFDKSVFTHNFDLYYVPGGDKEGSGALGTPTQEMVESYELATGGFPDWTPWHTTEGTTDTPPYTQLEPRFKATILYNGASWKGRTIEPYVGGKDGYAEWKVDAAPAGKSVTGYFLRKMLDEKLDLNTASSTQPWIEYRLGEVLLNYAEACFRTNDATNANASVRQIRQRVGLPYSDKSGDALMAAIRQERKVELAYEGLYYWDMRRWKLAETAFTGNRVHGLKIEKNPNETFTYIYVDCDKQDRNFPAKLYRLPIPVSELTNNDAVEQYPEWK